MLIISALFLQYLGCCAWYQANAQRSTFAALRISKPLRWLSRAAGWLISFGVFALLASQWGVERAVPLWLVVVVISAVASIFCSQWKPRQFNASAVLALVLGVALIAMNPATGGAL
ncbi:MAG: DUF3325 family protein [Xanthomonadales bacterium]|jgi:hypothetical protein|nr:DUF3325 family protein [Xanthomonadales bacterium]